MSNQKKHLKIMVVDDEILIQRSFALVAQTRGHNIKLASCGEEALQMWGSFQPDLVFLDILMPGIDGFSVLKNKPSDSHAKLIMMSAHNELDERIKQVKVDIFIRKPFHDIYRLMEQAEDLVMEQVEDLAKEITHAPEKDFNL